MKPVRSINIYISKIFFLKFLQVCAAFSLLIFFINLIDAFDKVRGSEAEILAVIALASLQIPDFLNDIAPSLVLIASIITFFLLSSRSEITIIRMSGFSLWQVLKPIAASSFALGIIWIALVGPLSVAMSKKFHSLEAKHVRLESRESIAPVNGIWLKQDNLEKSGEELIIKAERIYKKDLEFGGVTVWFFDQSGMFYKKLDAKHMRLNEGFWLLKNTTLNDAQSLNKSLGETSISTNLKEDFVMEKVVNNFQNVKMFSLFDLPKLIRDLDSSGFNSTKFRVYFYSLLSKPFLFSAMSLIACYFGLNHIRNQNSLLRIFIGVLIGLVLYISSSIISSLGSSGIISVFASTWVITFICLALGTLLIYQKENL